MTTLVLACPKGGTGRTTSTLWTAYEVALAHPEKQVVVEDLDPAMHGSRMFELYLRPVAPRNLVLRSPERPDDEQLWPDTLVLVDTAPEANRTGLLRILEHADWLLVPVKGPEAGSVQVLPEFLRWVADSPCRLLGFLPTLHHARRMEHQRWLGELERLAETLGSRLFDPIADCASLAAWRASGHPYRGLAEEVMRAIN